MAPIIENIYSGDGSTVLYSFTFPYIDSADIKVSLDGVETTEYTLANASTVLLNTAPASGVVIRIFRSTAVDALKSTFFPGSVIRAQDLNEGFEQSLYVAQESQRNAEQAYEAYPVAAEARSIANSAESTANQAEITANGADQKADTAIATANAADAVADSAATDATNAVDVANAAAAAVSDALTYQQVADVSSIPANPGSTDRVEVIDSTGIESFTPLLGLPQGFVGDNERLVRLLRNVGNTSWVYSSYQVIDPDARYAPIASPTFTGVATAPSFVGDLTGDVTGSVSGNVTGDVTGNVTGDVTGNLTGNVTGDTSGTHTGPVVGDVTGNVSGNASSANTATNASNLENLNSSQFVRSDATDTVSGSLTFSNITEFTRQGTAARFTGIANLTFGNDDARLFATYPNLYLDLHNDNFFIRNVDQTRFIFTKTGNFTAIGNISAGGDVTATGSLNGDSVSAAGDITAAGKLIANDNIVVNSVIQASGLSRSLANIGHNAIGMTHMLGKAGSTGAMTAGDTIAGSSLRPRAVDNNSVGNSGKNGTWRCHGYAGNNSTNYGDAGTTVWMRIL